MVNCRGTNVNDFIQSLIRLVPRQLLWILVSAVFSLQALRMLLQWVRRTGPMRNTREEQLAVTAGPLEDLRRHLWNARRSAHSREMVIRQLRDLTAGVISLGYGVNESAAMRMIAEGNWTSDSALLEMMERGRRGEWSSRRANREGMRFSGQVEDFLLRLEDFSRGGASDRSEALRGT